MSGTDAAAAALLLAAGLVLLAAAAWLAAVQPAPGSAAALPGERDAANLAGDVEGWLRREGY